jgi:hypothetical protein
MPDSSQRLSQVHDRSASARQAGPPLFDPSLVEQLRRIVRRILRARVGRTSFQARVLDEARVLRSDHGSEVGSEAFAGLVVDRLLKAAQDCWLIPAMQEASLDRSSTWGRILEATFQGVPLAPAKNPPCP